MNGGGKITKNCVVMVTMRNKKGLLRALQGRIA
jgi:hypothetical protein